MTDWTAIAKRNARSVQTTIGWIYWDRGAGAPLGSARHTRTARPHRVACGTARGRRARRFELAPRSDVPGLLVLRWEDAGGKVIAVKASSLPAGDFTAGVTCGSTPVAFSFMAITRLNHAVLYVRDVERSAAFYSDVLGFTPINMTPTGFKGAAFLRAPASTNDHDLGLFEIGLGAAPSGAGRTTVGLYHLAWEVDTLEELARLRDRLKEAGALVGASDHSTTKSLYAKDPDGIEFEVAWVVPADRLDTETIEGRKAIQPLDLEGEMERYGASTRGGVGISTH